MSIIETIDAFDKLEFSDVRAFAVASALIATSVQQYNDDPSGKINGLQLLYETESLETIEQQKSIERQWLENDTEIIPFISVLDACVNHSLSDRPSSWQKSLWLPFRADQPIDFEAIQWHDEPIPASRAVVQPASPNRVLRVRNEPNVNTNEQPTGTTADENEDQNYVDAVGDEENEAPKTTAKKKNKKKKQQPKVEIKRAPSNNDLSMLQQNQLNTSTNRTSSAGHKFPQKLSSKWSSGKRVLGLGSGKTSAIRKFARPSHERQQQRPDSRTLFRNKPSVTCNVSRLSQEQRDQLARAVEERKQEERKRKVEKLHEQAKKREEVLNRAKQIQQDKEQKNQLRVSDNQSKTGTAAAPVAVKKPPAVNFNNSTTFNSSMNETNYGGAGVTYTKTPGQIKPVVLDTTSNKILGQNKIFKTPATLTGGKKPTTAEYTFVVDKTNPQRNDMTLPSSSMAQPNAQQKADWTIAGHDELELDMTITDLAHDSADGDYGIDDVRSDQDSDNEDEDESRVPAWAKERLFQSFWKNQGHWYLSRRTLKLTRRTLGHYPVIKDQLQTWLKDLKSNKPLSETFTDATYLDQTQTPNLS